MIIGLTGTVWVPIEVNPRYAHLKGVVGDVVEKTVQLVAKKEEPLTLELASTSVPDKIDVVLQEVEKGRSYQVRVRNKVEGLASYNGKMVFKTNYAEIPELEVRVTGNISPVLEARPKTLSFGRISQPQIDRLLENKRSMTRPVMVILHKGTDLQVKEVRTEKSLFKVTAKPMENGRMIQVIVEADFTKLKKGINEDLLEITTNIVGSQVLKVPVRFELM